MLLKKSSQPYKVAVIGSGPAGFYSAYHLFLQARNVVIDMFERLPTPYGLVRHGVAPDHQSVKSVCGVFESVASNSGFRFFGNVEFGRHFLRSDLARHYHHVIYAVGSPVDRRLNIPGETLPGFHTSGEFIGWYNGHPGFSERHFNLNVTDVVIIGNGNVALDVARILLLPLDRLNKTDMADHALNAFKRRAIRRVHILGRRGPEHAAFNFALLNEFREIPDLRVRIAGINAKDKDWLAASGKKNIETLRDIINCEAPGSRAELIFHFYSKPERVIGEGRVSSVAVVSPPAASWIIPAGLVISAIGSTGEHLPGLPFDYQRGIIPNIKGRVLDPLSNNIYAGEYVAGWIKRGSNGTIGHNKPDAMETVTSMLEDYRSGRFMPEHHDAENQTDFSQISNLTTVFNFDNWRMLDTLEKQKGTVLGRPRVKFVALKEMIRALAIDGLS